MQRIMDADGAHPLFELETGRITEAAFLERLAGELEHDLGHLPEMHGFKEIYFEALHPNEPMIELMRSAKAAGLRMALLTNNVREWEPLWRPMLPVDEIFEFVVDSAFVGMRKPEPAIYELTIERLGDGVARRGLPVRRRHRGQRRRRPRARDGRRPLRHQRAGDPGDPRRARPLSRRSVALR